MVAVVVVPASVVAVVVDEVCGAVVCGVVVASRGSPVVVAARVVAHHRQHGRLDGVQLALQ